MPHLPPTYHETSKHDSSNETTIKEKQNETIPDSNSNLAKLMTHHNQIKELTTWFLNYFILNIFIMPYLPFLVAHMKPACFLTSNGKRGIVDKAYENRKDCCGGVIQELTKGEKKMAFTRV
jgi:hypothetical protein